MHVLYEIKHTVSQDDDSWEDSVAWKQEVRLIAASDNLTLLVEMKNENVAKQNSVYEARKEYRANMDRVYPYYFSSPKESSILTWFDRRQKSLDDFQKSCVEIVNLISNASGISKEEIISFSRKEFEIQSVEVL